MAKHGLRAGYVPFWVVSASWVGATPSKARRRILEAWLAEETIQSLVLPVLLYGCSSVLGLELGKGHCERMCGVGL